MDTHKMTRAYVRGDNEYTSGYRVMCSCGWLGPVRQNYENFQMHSLTSDELSHRREVNEAHAHESV